MRFGFHVSIAGGFSKVRARADEVECETLQLFTRNPRSWRVKPLDDSDVAGFHDRMEDSGISPLFTHAAYLPNLAASGSELAERSVSGVAEDMERSARLGIPFVIAHAGRAGDVGESKGIRCVAANINRIVSVAPESVMLLVENTAGMGTEVGYRFEQLADILDAVDCSDRVGVVLDTAHLFAAGYDLGVASGVDDVIREFDRVVGLGRLYLLHLNDSKSKCGSRVDRHWHIGQGAIGLEGFRAIVNHPLLRHMPAILETPRRNAADDKRNLLAIRRLLN